MIKDRGARVTIRSVSSSGTVFQHNIKAFLLVQDVSFSAIAKTNMMLNTK